MDDFNINEDAISHQYDSIHDSDTRIPNVATVSENTKKENSKMSDGSNIFQKESKQPIKTIEKIVSSLYNTHPHFSRGSMTSMLKQIVKQKEEMKQIEEKKSQQHLNTENYDAKSWSSTTVASGARNVVFEPMPQSLEHLNTLIEKSDYYDRESKIELLDIIQNQCISRQIEIEKQKTYILSECTMPPLEKLSKLSEMDSMIGSFKSMQSLCNKTLSKLESEPDWSTATVQPLEPKPETKASELRLAVPNSEQVEASQQKVRTRIRTNPHYDNKGNLYALENSQKIEIQIENREPSEKENLDAEKKTFGNLKSANFIESMEKLDDNYNGDDGEEEDEDENSENRESITEAMVSSVKSDISCKPRDIKSIINKYNKMSSGESQITNSTSTSCDVSETALNFNNNNSNISSIQIQFRLQK